MSLFQVWLGGESARVAVDTLALVRGTRQSMETSKLLSIPHAGVVLGYRGSDLAFFQLFAQMFLVADWHDFDSGKEKLPLKCVNAMTQWQHGFAPQVAQAQIILAGYSIENACMAATVFEVDVSAGKAIGRDIKHASCAPSGGSAFDASDKGMLAYAAGQVAWMRENEQEAATGGRLLCAELTHGSIAIRDLGAISQ